MRRDYTYTIEASEYDGNWELIDQGSERSARNASEYARALLESWIISNPSRLAGGERVEVYDGADDAPSDNLVHLRVSVYHGSGGEREPAPAAFSYLEYAESEY